MIGLSPGEVQNDLFMNQCLYFNQLNFMRILYDLNMNLIEISLLVKPWQQKNRPLIQ